MSVNFLPEADEIERRLFESGSRDYDAVWDVLERIAADPEEAKHARWTNYVSSRSVWGSRVPNSTYTVFWRTNTKGVLVVYLIEDIGF